MTWTGGNISGGCPTFDESCCVEELNNCETFTLTLRAGDYTGRVLTIELRWPGGVSDYNFFVHEGDLNGRLVGQGTSPYIGHENKTIALDPGQQQERVLAIHIVAITVAPDDNYSGSASLRSSGLLDCSFTNTNPDDRYAPDENPICEIPVVVHVLMSASEAGALSDEIIRSQIIVLNEDFRALPGTPGEPGTDTGIQFRLAEVTRTTNDFWFQDLPDPVNGNYWDVLARDPNRFCNIYTNNAQVNIGHGYTATTSVPGDPFAPQQGGVGSNADRIVMVYTVFGRPGITPLFDQGDATTHEMGHYLGLRHTFSGCEDEEENCYQSGDRICDTPPQLAPVQECAEDPMTCGDPDPIYNYMTYNTEACQNQFTPEQARRMRCTLIHYRPDLCSSVEEPEGAVAKVTGGGQIEDPLFALNGDLLSLPAVVASLSGGGAEANFGFVTREGDPPTGNLNYRDHGTGDDIRADSYATLEISGTHARFTGTATVNGVGGKSFEVEVDDLGEPGTAGDTFSIRILELGGYMNGGPLIRGNIQIHPARGGPSPMPEAGETVRPAAAGASWSFELGPARPNPTAGRVRIGYTLASEAEVSIRVYDVAGRLVRTLVAGRRGAAGPHEVAWDGRDETGRPAAEGVYFYRMTAGEWQSDRKLLLLAR